MTAVNDAGSVVGSYKTSNDRMRSFLYSSGVFTTIVDPSATGVTGVWGINNAGAMVGYFDDATGRHGFLDEGGTFTTLDYHP